LAIYLNDHLAAATGGVELARRARASNEDDDLLGPPLVTICEEVEADRETLVAIMEELGIRRDPVKPVAAWAAEKLGRLKPNGQLTGYSPLSRVVEMEVLLIGIAGKTGMWRALAQSLGPSVGEFDLVELEERGERQRSVVADLHLEATSRALPGSAS
jgi:hypothetical protein